MAELTGNMAWYKSKTVWSSIITAIIGAGTAICLAMGIDLNSNAIYGVVLTILGAFGLYSRVVATTKIG